MISSIISRLVILLFGTLYPAYASYKAVKTKNVKEYVKWMMYWIVFALFTCTETFTDIFLSWFPFYYEIKIILVIWLLSPATKGSSILYRKFVHPMLSSREQEIDEYISKAKEQSYRQVLDLGQKGMTALMQTAIKGGGGIVNQLKKSYSLSDLSDPTNDGNDEIDDVLVTDPRLMRRRKPGRSPHRSSSASSASVYFSEVDLSTTVVSGSGRVTEVRSIEDISSGYSSGEGLYAQHPLKLQARDSIATQRTNSLTRARSTRVTRSHVPKKTSGMSDDSDENEVFDTNIIFLNDKIQKIDKLTDKPESSSSETEFYDIPESNPFHAHGKPFEKEHPSSNNKHSECNLVLYRNETIFNYNNPENVTDIVSTRANSGYGEENKVTACKSDFSSSLSFNLTKLSNALSSLYPHSVSSFSKPGNADDHIEDSKLCHNNINQFKEANRKAETLKEQECFEGNYSKPEFKEKAQRVDVYKQKALNLKEEVSEVAALNVRGGKYNKKHAPLPPILSKTDGSNVNPIKATLVLQPGIVRSLSRSTDNIATKEMFFNYSPKARRKSRRRSPSPLSLKSSESNSSSRVGQALNKVLQFPKKMVHLNIPGRVKEKRNSWSGFFNAKKLGDSRVQSSSTSNLENRDVQTIDGAVKRTESQMSVKSLSVSPLAHRRLKIIRRYVDSDID